MVVVVVVLFLLVVVEYQVKLMLSDVELGQENYVTWRADRRATLGAVERVDYSDLRDLCAPKTRR